MSTSEQVTPRTSDHDEPTPRPAPPAPLVEVPATRARTAAEEARTLVAGTATATLATLSEDGSPWASLVTFATVGPGTPVLMVSTLAEHGRNLLRDPRASLMVAQPPVPDGDPLDAGRVTLLGEVEAPEGEDEWRAREAFGATAPASNLYGGFGDFSLWTLRVDRVRWVGGYGRMESADADAYRAAEPDPVAPVARGAVDHLNDDHADVLTLIARQLAGYGDATEARCVRADLYGLDLHVSTPRGRAPARVGFAERVTAPDGLRAASVELAQRARAGAGGTSG